MPNGDAAGWGGYGDMGWISGGGRGAPLIDEELLEQLRRIEEERIRAGEIQAGQGGQQQQQQRQRIPLWQGRRQLGAGIPLDLGGGAQNEAARRAAERERGLAMGEIEELIARAQAGYPGLDPLLQRMLSGEERPYGPEWVGMQMGRVGDVATAAARRAKQQLGRRLAGIGAAGRRGTSAERAIESQRMGAIQRGRTDIALGTRAANFQALQEAARLAMQRTAGEAAVVEPLAGRRFGARMQTGWAGSAWG